jgi:TM2 domain-containing membrane protein YozV
MRRLLCFVFLLSAFAAFPCSFSDEYARLEAGKPNPAWTRFFKKQAQRKRAIAAALAFPIPGGILGLHRIYLGTKPYVPLIYVITLGGGFLILPLVDFCVLLLNKDISRFENCPQLFMWIDNEKKGDKAPAN